MKPLKLFLILFTATTSLMYLCFAFVLLELNPLELMSGRSKMAYN